MGGLLILVVATVAFLVVPKYKVPALTVLFVTLGCGAIGFLDDFIKLTHRRSLGLRGRWKMLLLALITVGVGFAADHQHLPTDVFIPVVHWNVELSWGWYVLLFLVIVGAALIGAAIGFLWYNAFPAEVIMGDTGAMAIGGALAAMAIFTKTIFLLLLIGGIFAIEAISVIIQVISFKYFNRRVFLITPIHHHFEMKAWSETKIMVRFWIVTAILCAVGFALFYRDFTFFRR